MAQKKTETTRSNTAPAARKPSTAARPASSSKTSTPAVKVASHAPGEAKTKRIAVKASATAPVKASQAETAKSASARSKTATASAAAKPQKPAATVKAQPAAPAPKVAAPVAKVAGDKRAEPAAARGRAVTAAVSKPAGQSISAPVVPAKPATARPGATAPAAAPPEAPSPRAIAERMVAQRQQTLAQATQQAPAAAQAGPKKPISQRHGFKTGESIVYPAHGVGRIVGIEEQEIAGMSLELFVITFEKDKLTLRVPTGKLQSVGMRKLAEAPVVTKALDTLKGRARIKRLMWSRRAQEYEAKINSGDLVSIAEVVRDLYRSEQQPEQSYSERQLYEAALDRMAREIAAVDKIDERGAVQKISEVLSRSAKGRRLAAEGSEAEPSGDADPEPEAEAEAA